MSSIWGSFFYHPEDDPDHNRHMNTFWGELVTKYCDIAIPSIEYIAGIYSKIYDQIIARTGAKYCDIALPSIKYIAGIYCKIYNQILARTGDQIL